MSPQPTSPKTTPALIEWIFWSAITTGLIVLYIILGQRAAPAPNTHTLPPALAYAGLLPLAMGTALRWLVLPRITEPKKRLPLFIAGLALTEGCGLLAIFVGGPHKDTLFVLGMLGVAQFFPGLLPRPSPAASPFR
jgi:membrane protease YdiL (CAAX protease family)